MVSVLVQLSTLPTPIPLSCKWLFLSHVGPRVDLAEIKKTGVSSKRVTFTMGEGQGLRGISDESSRKGSSQDGRGTKGQVRIKKAGSKGTAWRTGQELS